MGKCLKTRQDGRNDGRTDRKTGGQKEGWKEGWFKELRFLGLKNKRPSEDIKMLIYISHSQRGGDKTVFICSRYEVMGLKNSGMEVYIMYQENLINNKDNEIIPSFPRYN